MDDSPPFEPSNVIPLFPGGVAPILEGPEEEVLGVPPPSGPSPSDVPERGESLTTSINPPLSGAGAGYGIASRLYEDLRAKRASPPQALEALYLVLARHRGGLSPDAPPADEPLLKVWSAQLERDYQASLAEQVVGGGKSATDELSLLLEQRVTLERAVLDPLTRAIDGAPPEGYKGDWPDPLLVSRWKKAQDQWQGLSQQIEESRQKATRVGIEARSAKWQKEYDECFAQLQETYADIGPQYGLLISRVASLNIRLRQAEESGRDIPLDEFSRLNELLLKFIAQLQKHQESTKSENLAGVTTAITRIMTELERELKASNPVMWGKIVGIAVRVTREEGLGMERPA